MKLFKMKNLIAICSLSLLMGACVLEDASSTEVSNQLDENQEVGETSGVDCEIVEEDSEENSNFDGNSIRLPKYEALDGNRIWVPKYEAFYMKVGDTFESHPRGVSVTLDSIVEDSRCSVDMECFQAGRLVLRVLVDLDGVTYEELMSTGPQNYCDSTSEVVSVFKENDFSFSIDDVGVDQTEEGLAQEDYNIHFRVIPVAVLPASLN